MSVYRTIGPLGFFLGSGRPHTRFSSNVVFIFQKSLNVWKDICLEAKHEGTHLMDQLKKKCHLKAEKNKLNHSGCLLSQILFTVLFAYVICMFFLFYYPTLSLLCMFQSYNDNLFCAWTSFCFFIGQNIIVVSFAIRNKAALRTLMQIFLAIYMALHIFSSLASLARYLRR